MKIIDVRTQDNRSPLSNPGFPEYKALVQPIDRDCRSFGRKLLH